MVVWLLAAIIGWGLTSAKELEELDFIAEPQNYEPIDSDGEDFRVITDSVQCYSCMSKFYGTEGMWDQLKHTYSKPANFSDDCNKGKSQKSIGLVTCPSICIKMWEKTSIGGHPFDGYIRGCYDKMLVRGFNQTLVRWYRWLQRDSCHYYSRKEVLQLPYNIPGHINICTCYSDGCNGAPRLSGAAKHRKSGLLWLFHYWPTILACLFPFIVLPSSENLWNSMIKSSTHSSGRSHTDSRNTVSLQRSENSLSSQASERHINSCTSHTSSPYCGEDLSRFAHHKCDSSPNSNRADTERRRYLLRDTVFRNRRKDTISRTFGYVHHCHE